MMPISLYDIEQAELRLAVERKRAANPNEGPPDFHDGVRFGEAATLATVTPLVQQLVEGMACLVLQKPLDDDMRKAFKDARAFLSGATKETDHV